MRIRIDTLVGMGFSNVIAIAIIMTTAATLHANGKTDIESSAQAAEALRPLAGAFAELIFALGIIGTGLLAIPVLAGSTAYAIGEGRKWPVGLSRKPNEAAAFYGVIAVSVLIGIGLNFTPLDSIKALYWSAVINGVPFVLRRLQDQQRGLTPSLGCRRRKAAQFANADALSTVPLRRGKAG
jgi:Mn2+/Fe2+ NRAMP family transporter